MSTHPNSIAAGKKNLIPPSAENRAKANVSPARSKRAKQLARYAQKHAEDAIDFFVEVMNDPDERTQDRIRAASLLLDRAMGKAPANVKLDVESTKTITADVRNLSTKELEQMLASRLPPPIEHAPPIDNSLPIEHTDGVVIERE